MFYNFLLRTEHAASREKTEQVKYEYYSYEKCVSITNSQSNHYVNVWFGWKKIFTSKSRTNVEKLQQETHFAKKKG